MSDPPVDDLLRLVPRGEGIWTISRPLSVMGAQFGRRQVLVTTADRAALISPWPLDEDVLAPALGGTAGNVTCLVRPSLFHDTWFPESMAHWPEAVTLIPQDEELTAAGPLPGILEPIHLEGMPSVRETVFFDHRSGSLIVSDLFFHFDAAWDRWSRAIFGLLGVAAGSRTSRMFRLMIRDRTAFRKSLDRLLEFPIQQIIPSHGRIIARNPQDPLESKRQGSHLLTCDEVADGRSLRVGYAASLAR